MEDFGEYTPPDSRSRRTACTGDRRCTTTTRPSTTAPRTDFSAAARVGRSAASTARAGPARRACSQIVWGGDPTTDWGFDGLRSAVRQGLTMGLSGVASGARTSAASSRSAPPADARAAEALDPVRRGLGRDAHPGQRLRAARQGRRAADLRRRRAAGAGAATRKLRTQLYPYLAAADAEYRRTGCRSCATSRWPIPDDPRAAARDDEYLFGPDLLAAPVIEPGATPPRALRAARHVGRPVALGRLPRARRRADAATAPARSGGGRRARRSRRRSTSCRCWCAPARSCRCCRPTSTRSPRYGGRGRRRAVRPRRPHRGCWPSRAAAAPPRCWARAELRLDRAPRTLDAAPSAAARAPHLRPPGLARRR